MICLMILKWLKSWDFPMTFRDHLMVQIGHFTAGESANGLRFFSARNEGTSLRTPATANNLLADIEDWPCETRANGRNSAVRVIQLLEFSISTTG